MAAAPNSLVVTGPNNQQVDGSSLLVTPTSGTQTTVADALSGTSTLPAVKATTVTGTTVVATTLNAGVVNMSGMLNESIANTVTASATQTLAGGTKITTNFAIVTKVATDFDALTLPVVSTVSGAAQSVFVMNTAAKKATVFPGEAGTKIDAGSAGAAVTITGASQAMFLQSGTGDWITFNGGTITKAT